LRRCATATARHWRRGRAAPLGKELVRRVGGMRAVAAVDWARAEQVAIMLSGLSPAPDADVDGWDPPIGLIEQQIEDVTGLRSVAGRRRST